MFLVSYDKLNLKALLSVPSLYFWNTFRGIDNCVFVAEDADADGDGF